MATHRTKRQREAARKALREYWRRVRCGEAERPRRGQDRPDLLFLRKGKLHKKIADEVNTLLRDIIAELGGAESVGVVERLVLRVVREHYTLLLLASAALESSENVFDKNGKLLPAARALPTHTRVLRQCLRLLNLSSTKSRRRQRQESALDQIRAEYAAKNKARA